MPKTHLRPLEDRLWEKVDKTGECWIWRGGTNGRYGHLSAGRRGEGHVYVHRLAYELLVGPIPEGLTIDHQCRNHRCVNPEHLEPVPLRENIKRAADQDRRSHCPSGHVFDDANTYRDSNGWRHCRSCGRERYHERKS